MIEFSFTLDRLTGNRVEVNGSIRRTTGSRRERERWAIEERCVAASTLHALKTVTTDPDARDMIDSALDRIGESTE